MSEESIVSMIWFIGLTLIFVTGSAIIDAKLIKDGKYINDHRPRWFFRAGVYFVVGFVSKEWLNSLGAAILFGVLFDQVLNYHLKKPLLHLGTTAFANSFASAKLYTGNHMILVKKRMKFLNF